MAADIWKTKWATLKQRAKAYGVDFQLTLEQYKALAVEAGIEAEQIGRCKGEYCVGRLGDVGPYTVGNCRFITVSQNHKEKVLNGGQARQTAKVKGIPNEKVARKLTGRNKHEYANLAHLADCNSKYFRVVSPTGEVFEGKNLNEFCKTHSLTQANLSAVCRGQAKHHKGWTGEYLYGGQ